MKIVNSIFAAFAAIALFAACADEPKSNTETTIDIDVADYNIDVVMNTDAIAGDNLGIYKATIISHYPEQRVVMVKITDCLVSSDKVFVFNGYGLSYISDNMFGGYKTGDAVIFKPIAYKLLEHKSIYIPEDLRYYFKVNSLQRAGNNATN